METIQNMNIKTQQPYVSSDFTRQAEIAIYAVQLAQDLQRSREEIVTAREEERRRMRRDLHDGLGPALAASFSQPDVSFTIQSESSLPELPAAYEVAIYHIVQEALANVVKHSQARTCTVRLMCDKSIYLEIQDDGIGIAKNRTSGVGLHSMRERAEELGGTCRITANSDSGTLILVSLPFRSSDGPD